jgi:hypothetical protein
MRVILDNTLHTINVDALRAGLEKDGLEYVSLSLDGELILIDGTSREVWQAMPEGAGANNTVWGDHAPGFEFCRSKR